jgi:hypothetical protein
VATEAHAELITRFSGSIIMAVYERLADQGEVEELVSKNWSFAWIVHQGILVSIANDHCKKLAHQSTKQSTQTRKEFRE